MWKFIYCFIMGSFRFGGYKHYYTPGLGFYADSSGGYIPAFEILGDVSYARPVPGKNCAMVCFQESNLPCEEDAKPGHVITEIFPDPYKSVSVKEMIEDIGKNYGLCKRVRVKLTDDYLYIGDEIFTKKHIHFVTEGDECIKIEHAHGGFHQPIIYIGKGCEYEITFIDYGGRVITDVEHKNAWAKIDEWFTGSYKVSN